MRVMVTGSRDWRDIDVIRRALHDVKVSTDATGTHALVNGCASGADAIARAIAVNWGWEPDDFWPEYHRYGFAEANLLRNTAMVESKPDMVLAFPTRQSRGTWQAVHAAKDRGYVEGETLFIYSEQTA